MKKLFGTIALFGLLLPAQPTQAIVVTRYFTYFEWGGNVYWGDVDDRKDAYKLHEASMSSLEIMDGIYAKNRTWVYFRGRIVDGAHPESFTVLGKGYAKDIARVFYNGKTVAGANLKTFEAVEVDKNYGYGKDKKHIFFDNKKTPFDAATFTYINNSYMADSSGIYFHSRYYWDHFYGQLEKVEGADPNDYRMIEDFLLSAGKVFMATEELNIDAGSFQLLDAYYSYMSTGKRVTDDYLIRDKDHVRLLFSKHDFDTESFRRLGYRLLCDKSGVYYHQNKHYDRLLMKLELDPNTVESYEAGEDYSYVAVLKDTAQAYLFEPQSNIIHKIRIPDVETLQLKEKTETKLIFTHKNGLYMVDSMHGLVKLEE